MTVTELSQLEGEGALGSNGKGSGLGCEPAEPQKTKESQAATGKRPLRTRSQDPTLQRCFICERSVLYMHRVEAGGLGTSGVPRLHRKDCSCTIHIREKGKKEEKVFTDS